MGNSGFSVRQRRVVVVGAARSGIAAAELLARRGARVTLTELRDAIDAAPALRASGVEIELGGHRPETMAAAELVVLSPGVAPRGGEHPSNQCRGRRLPFRSGDRNDSPPHPAPRKLQLADDLHASRARGVEDRLLERNARARDNQIRASERLGSMTARFERNTRRPQPRRIVTRLACFRQHHARASPRQQLRRRDPAARRTRHDNSAPCNRKVLCSHAITAASTS